MSKPLLTSVKETLGFEKVSSLEELFVEQLQDLYSAETQLIKALPMMADAATSRDLTKGFKHHLEQTKVHAERLEQILSRYDAKAEGKACQAMKGLIKEGNETITEYTTSEIKDAALIADAQRVEHYEIAGYGTVVSFAKLLGDTEAEETLAATLEEEAATDEKLTELSETLNLRPAKTSRGVTPAKSANRVK
jgi:ferritin-like metal-binding protein YciE